MKKPKLKKRYIISVGFPIKAGYGKTGYLKTHPLFRGRPAKETWPSLDRYSNCPKYRLILERI